ncbi:MAG: hypothetical protein AAF557_22965 [Pseudomonadota bacterium]
MTWLQWRPSGIHGSAEGQDWVDPTYTQESKGYIDERYDPETRLRYLHARYFDPILGLFRQGDWWDQHKTASGQTTMPILAEIL